MPSKLKRQNWETYYETGGVAHMEFGGDDQFLIVAHSNYAMRRVLKKLGLGKKLKAGPLKMPAPYYFQKVSVKPL